MKDKEQAKALDIAADNYLNAQIVVSSNEFRSIPKAFKAGHNHAKLHSEKQEGNRSYEQPKPAKSLQECMAISNFDLLTLYELKAIYARDGKEGSEYDRMINGIELYASQQRQIDLNIKPSLSSHPEYIKGSEDTIKLIKEQLK